MKLSKNMKIMIHCGINFFIIFCAYNSTQNLIAVLFLQINMN